MSSESPSPSGELSPPERIVSDSSSVRSGRKQPSRNLSNLPSRRARRREQERQSIDARPHVTISTRQILIDFTPPEPIVETAAKKAARAERKKARQNVREALRHVQQPSLGSWISRLARKTVSSEVPINRFTDKAVLDARDACRFFFPARSALPVHIVDFYDDKATRYTRPLGEIESIVQSKPDAVAVRWIHLNIGPGVLHSTIEDIFNYSGSARHGKPFAQTGNLAWPYLDNLQVMAFYSRKLYEDQVEAWNSLSQVASLKNGPTEDVLKGFSEVVADDLEWRGQVTRKNIDFWSLAKADLPFSMSDKMLGDLDLQNRRLPSDVSKLDQAVSLHPAFKDSLVMISHWRAFHRDDGFLLTFSSQPGINYNSNEFPDWLADAENIMDNPRASALAYLSDTFLNSGTSRWHRKTVEWLAVFIMTEIATTPNSIRTGGGCQDLLGAYRDLAVQLKEQQKNPWERGEAVKLVRRYLSSIDELRVVQAVAARKLDLMERLLKDCERMEQEFNESGEYVNQDPEAEAMTERAAWAIGQLVDEKTRFEAILDHYQTALNEFFLLGTVEQNELAIVADHQNKAVMLFTIVTIIFLPLSFFTSYFGMNVRGIAEAERDEKYFWLSCGIAGFVIVTVLFTYAFRTQALKAVRGFKRAGKIPTNNI
ncbi:hypothetical protein jhhlp_005325 [Lomentospora prolificans]|uniref:Magnesium transporter n=1 Tax=Lomentospora prolificans TaxID=41688 RepID=A0A2N3N7G4_9PEZI|nr:hypothetical protein jhhlp_005325 [Lomentospora prolificans]